MVSSEGFQTGLPASRRQFPPTSGLTSRAGCAQGAGRSSQGTDSWRGDLNHQESGATAPGAVTEGQASSTSSLSQLRISPRDRDKTCFAKHLLVRTKQKPSESNPKLQLSHMPNPRGAPSYRLSSDHLPAFHLPPRGVNLPQVTSLKAEHSEKKRSMAHRSVALQLKGCGWLEM